MFKEIIEEFGLKGVFDGPPDHHTKGTFGDELLENLAQQHGEASCKKRILLCCSILPRKPATLEGLVQTLMLLPHPKRLAQERDRPSYTHPPDERHPTCRQRQPLRRDHE